MCFSRCVSVWACGDEHEQSKSRSDPPRYIFDVEPRPVVEYDIPDGIPPVIVEKYADMQELLTENQFKYFLITVYKYCNGEIDDNLMKVRVSAKLGAKLPDRVQRELLLPFYGRSDDD